MRRVAAEISGVDDGVGRVLEALKKHKLEENTLVVFTADQGWGGGQHGIWGMGDHTRPLHAFDETMRVPLIVRHPGTVPAGQRRDLLVSNYDLFPTLLDYLGLKDKAPQKPALPGRSFAAALRSKEVEWDDIVFYEFENTRAVRTAEWKYVHRFPKGPDELYDLKNDPGEKKNLVDQPGRPCTGKQVHPPADCAVLKRDHEPAYISWERFLANVQRLDANRTNQDQPGPPRKGPALLKGLLRGGRCRQRMKVRYSGPKNTTSYVCTANTSSYGEPLCQSLSGQGLDDLVAAQLLGAVEPAALEASLAAVADIERERAELLKQWNLRIERVHYEAERAGRQYHACEPENRLVARAGATLGGNTQAAASAGRGVRELEAVGARAAVGRGSGVHPRPGSRPAGLVACRDNHAAGPAADGPAVAGASCRHCG